MALTSIAQRLVPRTDKHTDTASAVWTLFAIVKAGLRLVEILKSNPEKKEDFVATGILGRTVPRRTRDCRSSLGDSPVAPTACPSILLTLRSYPIRAQNF
jgi:hypothetical protein